jgi:hypothetical protein
MPANRPVLKLIAGDAEGAGSSRDQADAADQRPSTAITDAETRLQAAAEAALIADWETALDELVTAVERATAACTIAVREAAR